LVDYGMGNLFSVSQALERSGASVVLSDSADVIRRAHKLVLPGVGAFGVGMSAMRERDLIEPIKDAVSGGSSLLGICLGMQMLFTSSHEFGLTPGLNLIPGEVVPIPNRGTEGERLKIPHIGWGELTLLSVDALKNSPFVTLRPDEAFYFVHSFMAVPRDQSHCFASCLVGGHLIPAVVGAGRVWGCQFHPEKSQPYGLRILENFVDWES